MEPEVLSRPALNRALLQGSGYAARPGARRPGGLQGPAAPLTLEALRPGAASVLEMVEHLVGMQAQAPFPPYFGLLARLDGFRAGGPGRAAAEPGRGADRADARDHPPGLGPGLPALRPLIQPVLDRALAATFGRPARRRRLPAVAAAGRAAGRGAAADVRRARRRCWPRRGRAIRRPPSRRRSGPGAPGPGAAARGLGPGRARPAHTPAETWLGRPLDAGALAGRHGRGATWPPSARPRAWTCRPGRA